MIDPYETEKIYPALKSPPPPLQLSPHEFRVNSYKKILGLIEADVKHYGSTLKKYTRSRNIFSYLAGATTGASVVLSAGGAGTSATVVGIPIGVALASIGGLCAALGLAFGLASRKMSKKVSKHVDNVARAKATIVAIESAISKALRDGVISDEEFRVVTNIDNKYHGRIASNRRSTGPEDLKKMREQIEVEIQAGITEFLLSKKEPTPRHTTPTAPPLES